MKIVCRGLCLTAIVILGGCGASERPIKDDLRDPLVYASAVKSRVATYLERIKKNPQLGKDRASYLVEFLESAQSSSAPVGEHRETYNRLLSTSKQLLVMLQAGASDGKQRAEKIMEILDLANQLPGEMVVGSDG